MNQTTRTRPWLSVTALLLSLVIPVYIFAQGGGGGGGQGKGGGGGGKGGAPAAPVAPRAAAPIDLTGYWVSLVTEDWLYRMVTPAKGDTASVPINNQGKQAAAAWDPAKDEAAGEQCKAYGAAAIVRVPGRIHIDWQDDNTLKLDFDAGTQTRLLHFGGTPPASGDTGYQGYSVASWEGLGRGGRGVFGLPNGGAGITGGDTGKAGGAQPVRPGSLKVVTTRMKPGYLRKNGVPYSANTVLTEYFDKVTEPDGETLLIVSTIVDDPQYLTQQFLTSTHFKKEPDGAKWSPSTCSAR
ncbi:MAG: hypothetical protein JWO19_3953 [Bryobacterales bacterium]|nr:hypothetical protein [Bryobacterales bacterium]